jgi:very-short-patch-repair endonuclease
MKPNKQEQKLQRIIDRIFPNFEFKYNGDFRLGVMIDRLIPDFVNVNGKKKLIELFGVHWHKKEEEQQRIERYRKLGFETLVIWDSELQNENLVEERIKTFTFNPNVKIVKITSITRIPFKGKVFNIETQKNHNYFARGILVHNCGEGGMCVTDSKSTAEKLVSLRGLAFGNTPGTRFVHTDLGFNYRLTNIQAAIGCAQLSIIDDIVRRKRQMAAWYNEGLKSVKGITLPVEMPWAKNVYWQYGIVLDREFGMSRDKLLSSLEKEKIGARAFFVPMHQQPVFHKLGLFKGIQLPVSEWLGRNGLYLPSSAKVSRADVIRVCNVIKRLSG